MGYVDDTDALFFQSPDGAEQLFRLTISQRCCRLIKDENFGFKPKCFGNLDHLSLSARKMPDQCIQRDMKLQLIQQSLCFGAHGRFFEKKPAALFACQKQIFQYRQIRNKAELLKHRRDVKLTCKCRVHFVVGLSVHRQLSCRWLESSNNQIDERRLTRTIFTEKRVDLARLQV